MDKGKGARWRSTQPMKILIPGAYNVGGRRVTKPTGRVRDSSLRINKAPGMRYSCREAQIAITNIGCLAAQSQRYGTPLHQLSPLL